MYNYTKMVENTKVVDKTKLVNRTKLVDYTKLVEKMVDNTPPLWNFYENSSDLVA